LSTQSIPTRNWINETLTFTHGLRFDARTGESGDAGRPAVLIVGDIPPVSTEAAIKVSRPEIYYGKLSSKYVMVNTKSKEFISLREQNIFTKYAGKAGSR
jgi:uncharacterized membrane protein (UPF0182 family)